jgi:hypothetical protein
LSIDKKGKGKQIASPNRKGLSNHTFTEMDELDVVANATFEVARSKRLFECVIGAPGSSSPRMVTSSEDVEAELSQIFKMLEGNGGLMTVADCIVTFSERVFTKSFTDTEKSIQSINEFLATMLNPVTVALDEREEKSHATTTTEGDGGDDQVTKTKWLVPPGGRVRWSPTTRRKWLDSIMQRSSMSFETGKAWSTDAFGSRSFMFSQRIGLVVTVSVVNALLRLVSGLLKSTNPPHDMDSERFNAAVSDQTVKAGEIDKCWGRFRLWLSTHASNQRCTDMATSMCMEDIVSSSSGDREASEQRIKTVVKNRNKFTKEIVAGTFFQDISNFVESAKWAVCMMGFLERSRDMLGHDRRDGDGDDAQHQDHVETAGTLRAIFDEMCIVVCRDERQGARGRGGGCGGDGPSSTNAAEDDGAGNVPSSIATGRSATDADANEDGEGSDEVDSQQQSEMVRQAALALLSEDIGMWMNNEDDIMENAKVTEFVTNVGGFQEAAFLYYKLVVKKIRELGIKRSLDDDLVYRPMGVTVLDPVTKKVKYVQVRVLTLFGDGTIEDMLSYFGTIRSNTLIWLLNTIFSLVKTTAAKLREDKTLIPRVRIDKGIHLFYPQGYVNVPYMRHCPLDASPEDLDRVLLHGSYAVKMHRSNKITYKKWKMITKMMDICRERLESLDGYFLPVKDHTALDPDMPTNMYSRHLKFVHAGDKAVKADMNNSSIVKKRVDLMDCDGAGASEETVDLLASDDEDMLADSSDEGGNEETGGGGGGGPSTAAAESSSSSSSSSTQVINTIKKKNKNFFAFERPAARPGDKRARPESAQRPPPTTGNDHARRRKKRKSYSSFSSNNASRRSDINATNVLLFESFKYMLSIGATAVDQVLSFQLTGDLSSRADDLKETDIRFIADLYALYGRAFFNVGTWDHLSVLTTFSGSGATGKKVLLSILAHCFPPHRVGAMAGNTEKQFGLASFKNSDVVLMADVRKLNIATDDILTSLDADRTTYARKYKQGGDTGKFKGAMFSCTNLPATLPREIAGALDRREAVFYTDHRVPEENRDQGFGSCAQLENDVVPFIFQCMFCYHRLRLRFLTMNGDFFGTAHPRFKEMSVRAQRESVPFLRFLYKSGMVALGENFSCPEEDLMSTFSKWMSSQRGSSSRSVINDHQESSIWSEIRDAYFSTAGLTLVPETDTTVALVNGVKKRFNNSSTE